MNTIARIIGRGRAFAWTAAGIAALAVIFVLAAFEPATRYVAADQFVCFGCHVSDNYDISGESPISKPHPADPETSPARCVECHVPEGLVESLYIYSHIFSRTDLLGNWRGIRANIDGPYHPPMAKRAYRVRDALFDDDSSTCRTCHIEEEIKPERRRGQNAHRRALDKKQTCIECHFNVAHREIPFLMPE